MSQNQPPQTDTKVQTPAKVAAPPAGLLERYEFGLATDDLSNVGNKPALPSASAVSDATLARLTKDIEEEHRRNGKSPRYHDLVASLHRDLQTYANRLDTLIDFLTTTPGVDLGSSAKVQQLAREQSAAVRKAFDEGMRKTLAAQRSLEQNVQSVNAFFLEAGCDGEAKSVYLVNHNPVTDDLAKSLGETSIQEMPPDPALGDLHPIWDTSVDADGKPMAVTFRPMKDTNIIQHMCAAMAVGANFEGMIQMDYWAKKARDSMAVAVVNVDPSLVSKEKPWNPQETPKELRRLYTSESVDFQNVVAVANHPIVRAASKYETSPVLAYPGFALLGKIYYAEKVDGRSMTCSPINPNRDALKTQWIKGLAWPWVRNRRSELNQINVVFIDQADNRLGDDVTTHFNSACTAYANNRYPFTLRLGENWLQKLVTHHLLQNVGAPNTNEAAQEIGQSLSYKLSGFSDASSESKPFLQAWVDYESSCCKRDEAVGPDGKPMKDADGGPIYVGPLKQVHQIKVKYREGIEDFHVIVVKV
jgi:hypothetical protein